MFRLSKYIYMIGVPIMIISIVLLSWIYRVVAFTDIKKQSEKSNIILTQTIANIIWPQIRGLVVTANSSVTGNEGNDVARIKLAFDMIQVVLDEPIKEVVVGTQVLRVKLFNLQGLTVYSTEGTTYEKLKTANFVGIVKARNGSVFNHIENRAALTKLDGEILTDRYVLSSYMPIKDPTTSEVEGILQIDTDVTDIFDQINISQARFTLVVTCVLLIVFSILIYILRRLDKAILSNIELAVARDSAKAASNAKGLFLATMSHELRTPLNAIIGYSEILAEDSEMAMSNSDAEDLFRIHSSARHLLHLINEILDLSKIEAGQMTIYKEDVDINELVDDVVGVVELTCQKSKNRFVVNIDKNVQTVHTDLLKIRQILFNLLSNAAKFTKQGEINITVTFENLWLEIIVADTGIGLTDEQLSHLFQPFRQADQSTTREYGGTGLGLNITQQFCNMLGGSISVTSTVGEGSSFKVLLPCHEDEDLNSDNNIADQSAA